MASFLPYIQQVSVFLFLVGSMLAMGMQLQPRALVSALRDARLVSVALGLNFLVAPAFAWLLTNWIQLERGYAIGLLLLSSAAGAPFLPKLVESAHGDLLTSGALMILLTVGTILSMPLALPFLIHGLQIDPWKIAGPLVLLIGLPLAVGLVIHGCAAGLATRFAPVIARIGNAGLLLLVALLVGQNLRALPGLIGGGAIITAGVYFLGLFAAGWLCGGVRPEIRGVVGLATGARNFGAAFAPAAAFDDPKISLMLVVSALVTLPLSFAAAGWVRARQTILPA